MKNWGMRQVSGAMAILIAAVLCGAIIGRAQSAFPIRFDDHSEVRAVGTYDGVALEAIEFVARNTPPVTCNANHTGFVYFQVDVNDNWTQNNGPDQGLCLCVKCDSGCIGAGFPSADDGYQWWSAGGVSCTTMLMP